MAHDQQIKFCLGVKHLFPGMFYESNVLDVGSFDCNGSNKFLFDSCEFTGIDIADGPGVDAVCPGQEYDAPDSYFDTIISTECFEHNPFVKETIENIVRMLRPGGLFLFTCATTGRPVHGVASMEKTCSSQYSDWKTLPNVRLESWDNEYYRNLDENDIREIINIDSVFLKHEFSINREHCDLYFWGIKK